MSKMTEGTLDVKDLLAALRVATEEQRRDILTALHTGIDAPAVAGGAPSADAYRLAEDSIDMSKCLGRKLRGGKDKRWKPAVYRESQCGAKVEGGCDLCTTCQRRMEKFVENPKPGDWHGRVTEAPPDWAHMLGTEWAETKKPKWLGGGAAAAEEDNIHAPHEGIHLEVREHDDPSADAAAAPAAIRCVEIRSDGAGREFIANPGPVRKPGKWQHHTPTSATGCAVQMKELPCGRIQLIAKTASGADAYLHGLEHPLRPIWSTHAKMPTCAFWERTAGLHRAFSLRFIPKGDGARFFAENAHYLAPGPGGTLCLQTEPHYWVALSV
jgi:hypothetical protein